MKDTSVIPKGPYCYDENGLCPYWSRNGWYHEQEDGYCAYLGKGDWNLNLEKNWRLVYKNGQTITDSEWQSAAAIGLPLSLLWDQCKECGVNEEEENV